LTLELVENSLTFVWNQVKSDMSADMGRSEKIGHVLANSKDFISLLAC
jgi:hypothetical protein